MSVDIENHDAILSDALKLAESGNLAAATDALRSALEVDFRGEVAGLVTEFEDVLRTGVGAALATETLRLLVAQYTAPSAELKPEDVRPQRGPVPEASSAFETAPRKSASNPITSTLAKLRDRLSGSAGVHDTRRQEALNQPPRDRASASPATGAEQEAREGTQQGAAAAAEPAASSATAREIRWFDDEAFEISESSPSIAVPSQAEAEVSQSPQALGQSSSIENAAGAALNDTTPFGFADADEEAEVEPERHSDPEVAATRTPSSEPEPQSQLSAALRRSRNEQKTRPRGPTLSESQRTARIQPVPEASKTPVVPVPAPVVTPSVSELLDHARTLMLRGDLASAVETLEQVLVLEPDHSEALARRADAETRIGMLRLSALEPLDRVPHVDAATMGSVQLTPQSMFIVSLADGSLTLRDLMDMSGMTQVKAAQILTTLIEAGVFRLQ